MNNVFEKQLQKTDLPRNKLEATNTSNLVSLVSQMHKYLSADEIEHIKTEGKRVAESEILAGEEEQIEDLPERQWTREEKWCLTWATEYAKLNSKSNLKKC